MTTTGPRGGPPTTKMPWPWRVRLPISTRSRSGARTPRHLADLLYRNGATQRSVRGRTTRHHLVPRHRQRRRAGGLRLPATLTEGTVYSIVSSRGRRLPTIFDRCLPSRSPRPYSVISNYPTASPRAPFVWRRRSRRGRTATTTRSRRSKRGWRTTTVTTSSLRCRQTGRTRSTTSCSTPTSASANSSRRPPP